MDRFLGAIPRAHLALPARCGQVDNAPISVLSRRVALLDSCRQFRFTADESLSPVEAETTGLSRWLPKPSRNFELGAGRPPFRKPLTHANERLAFGVHYCQVDRPTDGRIVGS